MLLTLVAISCRKGDFSENMPPETSMAVEAINLSGENRLNSEVHLNWYGTDEDGYVEGYEISLDGENWSYTTEEDSTFIFELEPGQDTTDIDFYVRAIDNKGAKDQTAAYLRVPLKNSPPQASFLDERGPGDTAFVVSTFFWNASDPDGNATIRQAFIKFNEGDWTEIDKNQPLISFVVDTSTQTGTASATVYYGKNDRAETFSMEGLKPNAENQVYLKVVDLANAESKVDTAATFYLKNKTPGASTLLVSGHTASIASIYGGYLNTNNIDHDFLNYGAEQGARQPIYWDPTFKLILNLYSEVFVTAPTTKFLNTVTGQNATLLTYIAPMIQDFYADGNNIFTTCILDKSDDLSAIAGPFPIEEDLVQTGQVRVYPDSLVYPDPAATIANSPILQPVNVQTGINPITPSADADVYYRAELTPIGGWSGDNVVAATRSQSGKLRQVFFAIELHNFNANAGTIESLIGQIFNNEF